MKILLFICLLFFIESVYASASCTRYFSNFSSFEEILVEAKLKDFKNITNNSSYQLRNALEVLAEQFHMTFRDQDEFFVIEHSIIYVQKSLIRNIHAFPSRDIKKAYASAALTYSALRLSGISKEQSIQLALRTFKHACLTLGLPYSQLMPAFEVQFQSKVFLDAISKFISQYEVIYDYNIPYIAGYSTESKRIYVDPLFTETDYLPFLVAHEAFEKEFLSLLPFPSRNYFIAHHLAQRLEMDFVNFRGNSWKEYQYGYINQIESIIFNKIYTSKVRPDDLNLIPYRDMGDLNLMLKIPEKSVKKLETNHLFTARQIRPGVFYLEFNQKRRMAITLVRFQEYYESPFMSGRIFTRRELQLEYRARKGKFDYYTFWADGFNFPGSTLDSFWQGHFKNLTPDEKLVLNFLKKYRHVPFYVIATAKDSEAATLDHEIAHSFFALYPNYKDEALKILSEIDIKPVQDFLIEKYADYADKVLVDEVHAWLMHNSEDLAADGFDITPYMQTIRKLQKLFYNHVDNLAKQLAN